jgi:hypothetical protein
MMHGEILITCLEKHMKLINTLCVKNADILILQQVVHIVTTGLLKSLNTDKKHCPTIALQQNIWEQCTVLSYVT